MSTAMMQQVEVANANLRDSRRMQWVAQAFTAAFLTKEA